MPLASSPGPLWLTREMNPVPYGIDVTPDGKIWFTQFNNRSIGYIDPATEAITVIDTVFRSASYACRQSRYALDPFV